MWLERSVKQLNPSFFPQRDVIIFSTSSGPLELIVQENSNSDQATRIIPLASVNDFSFHQRRGSNSGRRQERFTDRDGHRSDEEERYLREYRIGYSRGTFP